MELFFLAVLVLLMASALASGFPVAFALPGSAILTISLAAAAGYLFAGDASAYFAQGGPYQWLSAGVTNFRGIYWEVERDTLIAIPLFVFMGIMLQRSKIAEDLLVTMAQLFGPVPGGLGISVVFVGALLAATTGIVGATVVAMGLISLPAMLRNNYSHSLATGTIAASGTLGQIIPPSIVLIILADQLASAVDQAGTARKALYKAATGEFGMPSEFGVVSTSAGDMFLGAFVPGLILVGLYMVFILVLALVRPKLAPAVPFEGKYDGAFMFRVFLSLVPPLALIFVVLGSIIMGIATVNQAGAIGAVGATIMAGYRLKEGHSRAFYPAILAVLSLVVIFIVTSLYPTNIKNIKTDDDLVGILLASAAVTVFLVAVAWSGWRVHRIEDTLRGVMVETAKTTSLVFIILLGAAMLTAAFRAFGGEELVRDFLTSLPGGFWGQFIIVMAVIFVLGFFLDFIEIAVVVVPIVAPILLMDPSANVTAVWLGVMIGLNIQTSFLTPPFGFALFYLRGVAPAIVRTVSMYKGVVAFIALQLIALVIVGLAPQLVNYLPNRLSLTSSTAPPPLNPRLQLCLEEFVREEMKTNGESLRSAIADIKAQNIDYLPRKLKNGLAKGFEQADATFGLMDAISVETAKVEAAKPAYVPLHRQVRQIEKDMRRLDAEIEEATDEADRRRRAGDENAAAGFEAHAAELAAERKALEDSIPADWQERHDAFASVLDGESKARKAYQRAADDSYEAVASTIAILSDNTAFLALEEKIRGLESLITSSDPKAASEIVQDVSKEVRAVEGTSSIRSQLSKMRKALRSRTPDPEEAREAYDKAMEIYSSEAEWRKKATSELLPALQTYEAAIRDTIGVRQLSRLPERHALFVAGCNAVHRDISLYF